MSLINMTNLVGDPLNGLPTRRGYEPTATFSRRGAASQASITYYDPDTGAAAIRVTVLPSYLYGRSSNFLKFGLYLQAGVRYFMTLYEDDNDKLDGTVSTAGHELGATTAAAVVAKINSSALNAFVSAQLLSNFTNKDYTGAAGITASDALPMTGGRG